jgi:hypothetical protein
MGAASFRRTLFLTRVPKGTGRFLMRRLASFIYFEFQKKYSVLKDDRIFLLMKKGCHGASPSFDACTS